MSSEKHGKRTFVAHAPKGNGGRAMVVVRCDCGTEDTVRLGRWRGESGDQMCRFCRSKKGNQVPRSHGKTYTTEYRTWKDMKQRCFNPDNAYYDYYAGRGITVCDEWAKSFEAFIAHIGPKPRAGLSLDRIDNDGDYEPGNVRWATQSQQNFNKRKAHSHRNTEHSRSL